SSRPGTPTRRLSSLWRCCVVSSVLGARSDLGAALVAAWERSDRLFAWVAEEALAARPIRLRQPFLFYFGHLPAFAWNHLARRTVGWASFAPDFDALFEAGIDPPDDADPAGEPAEWPALAAVMAYRDRVREDLERTFDDPRVAGVLPMVLEHELMHHETLT